ncbi:MAG: hypothetical protein Q9M28_07730 [Mariprofundaceae bacterium]|nr:hypothetical protein [Mariprofundaceae bacterium]
MYKIILCAILSFFFLNTAYAGETRNINFAAFQKADKAFEYEPIVLGAFSDFISAMKGSQVLVLAHTADAIDGDVMAVHMDVLRDEKGKFGDFGINCEMIFKDDSTATNPSYMIGGLCKIIRIGRGQDLKLSAIIPQMDVPDTAQGIDAWVMLYEDKQTGIAFYANVSASK